MVATVPSHPFDDPAIVRRSRKKMRTDKCILCRGTRMLCGKTRCPIMAKVYANVKAVALSHDLPGML